jgi:hypothetical protein
MSSYVAKFLPFSSTYDERYRLRMRAATSRTIKVAAPR